MARSDPKSEMTDDQAISILSKMEVEQATLSSLWDQFSVAIRHTKEVINYFKELSKEVGGLRSEKISLVRQVDDLKGQVARNQARADEEDAKYRRALDEERKELQQSVVDARNRATAASQAAVEAEASARDRRNVLTADISELETQLAEAKEAYEAFLEKVKPR